MGGDGEHRAVAGDVLLAGRSRHHADPNSDCDADEYAHPNSDANEHSDTLAHGDSDALGHANSNGDRDEYSHPNGYSHGNADTDSDADPNENADGHAHARNRAPEVSARRILREAVTRTQESEALETSDFWPCSL